MIAPLFRLVEKKRVMSGGGNPGMESGKATLRRKREIYPRSQKGIAALSRHTWRGEEGFVSKRKTVLKNRSVQLP